MRRLVALPFSKSFQMAFQSIRVRFFRSLITTVSLVLAVAFVTYTQCSNNIAADLAASADSSFIAALVKAGYDIADDNPAITGSAKQRWIVFLSLLVCIVGIINAQLMSVTERFREIGTLKCLGALDRFVVRIFLIEAALQGGAGGIAGAVAGAVIALATATVKYGWASLGHVDWWVLGLTMGGAIITGTLLSLLGVFYPAIVAARMQPVEAMRVEQ